jgi:hypothetical protein
MKAITEGRPREQLRTVQLEQRRHQFGFFGESVV